MHSNITRYLALLLLVIIPFAVCSCSDNTPTSTADSVGSPAGWNGKHVKMGITPVGAHKPPVAANN